MIPDEIDIPHTDLQIIGGVSSDFNIVNNSYIDIPTDIFIQNKLYPYNGSNLA